MSTPNIQYSICGVIPPHMQRHIAEYGDDDSRETIASTLQHTHVIVRDRAASLIAHPAVQRSPEKLRRVYDAATKTTLPGKLVIQESKRVTTRDVEAKEAFDGSGDMWDFLWKNFDRNSIDGRGMALIATVHFGVRFANAMWNGDQMIFGDGDGRIFNRFTYAKDVMGHEFAHGMTQHDSRLGYHDQPGALNEHISDVMGILFKQWWLALKAADSSWVIGEGLFLPGINGIGIRSMKDPGSAYNDPLLGKDPQPAHMKNYVHGPDDNGGVHINSGILNHAFYLAAIEIGDYAWKVPGQVWYRTAKEKLSPRSGFQDFANATVEMAGSMFGENGKVQTSIRNAWARVGLTVPPKLLESRVGNVIRQAA